MRWILYVVAACCAMAQPVDPLTLARLLSDQETRARGVEIAVSTGQLPLLLTWTEHPPVGLLPPEDPFALEAFHVGLADAFTRLKPEAAIPFLIDNLEASRYPLDVFPALKAESVVKERRPAVAALIAIGPAAARAVIKEWPKLAESNRREAAIFVVGHIRDEQSRDFLVAIRDSPRYDVEKWLADGGLKLLTEP